MEFTWSSFMQIIARWWNGTDVTDPPPDTDSDDSDIERASPSDSSTDGEYALTSDEWTDDDASE